MNDIVITGAGVVSPIGIGLDPYWSSISNRVTGIHRLELADEAPLPYPMGAPIPDFDPKAFVKPRKSMKVMCREIQTGFAAAEMAIEHAQLDTEQVDSDRMGVVYGSDMLYCDVSELAKAYQICLREDGFVFDQWGARAINELYPLWMLRYLPNMTACHVGIRHDARGPNNTIVQGESSALLAFIEAIRVLQRGQVDVIIAGASGNRLSLTPMLFRGNAGVSRRFDEPEKACRPFDIDRDGMVYGEGAAAMVLETRAHAEARGANILATVKGYGQAYNPLGDNDEGLTASTVRAMKLALETASVAPDDIGHVNANGLSTVNADRAEARAIREVLGDTPVFAPKSYWGNLGAASAAVEMIASLLAIKHKVIPATLNIDTVDPECDINVNPEALPLTKPDVMMLSQSTTGQSAAVVFS